MAFLPEEAGISTGIRAASHAADAHRAESHGGQHARIAETDGAARPTARYEHRRGLSSRRDPWEREHRFADAGALVDALRDRLAARVEADAEPDLIRAEVDGRYRMLDLIGESGMGQFQKSLECYDVLDRIAVGGMAEVFLAKAYGAHGSRRPSRSSASSPSSPAIQSLLHGSSPRPRST